MFPPGAASRATTSCASTPSRCVGRPTRSGRCPPRWVTERRPARPAGKRSMPTRAARTAAGAGRTGLHVHDLLTAVGKGKNDEFKRAHAEVGVRRVGRQPGRALRAARAVGPVDRRHHRALVSTSSDGATIWTPWPIGCARPSPRRRRGGPQGAAASSTSVEAAIVREALDWYDDGPDAVEQILAKATRLRRKSFEGGPAVSGDAGEQRAVHRPVRHGAGHRDRVPRAGQQPDGRRWATSWAASPRR